MNNPQSHQQKDYTDNRSYPLNAHSFFPIALSPQQLYAQRQQQQQQQIELQQRHNKLRLSHLALGHREMHVDYGSNEEDDVKLKNIMRLETLFIVFLLLSLF